MEDCCQTSSVLGRREGHRAPLNCLKCCVNERRKNARASKGAFKMGEEWEPSRTNAHTISNILSSELCAHCASIAWAGSPVFHTHRWLAPAMAHIYCLSSIPPQECGDVLPKETIDRRFKVCKFSSTVSLALHSKGITKSLCLRRLLTSSYFWISFLLLNLISI